MRHRLLGVALAVVAVVATASVLSAHHSVAGQFDESKSVTLKGVISKVDWVNPHIYLYIDVKTDGETVTWSLGTVPTAMARRAGLTKESISGKVGEVVTIECIPARDGTKHLGWVNTITYADGHKIELSRR
ncbi:MAG TPA: DUF6152 family protein [Vicinamibacterales bacterium]|jgi:uncharacterized protein DUF6152|nr:DUF6152 family protein [Vicinamibacterales bacterium]